MISCMSSILSRDVAQYFQRRVYIDERLSRSLDIRFNTPFFARGTFPPEYKNGTETVPLTNPWLDRGNSAPFDQRKWFSDGSKVALLNFCSGFYLILHLAVGGFVFIFLSFVLLLTRHTNTGPTAFSRTVSAINPGLMLLTVSNTFHKIFFDIYSWL